MVPSGCYVVQSGFVKAFTITADGNEKPISFESSFDLFPVDFLFGHSTEARYYYEAYTDCQVYHVPRDDFLRFINATPGRFKRLFHYLIDRTLHYHAHISSLEQPKAAGKLVHALQFLSRRFGRRVGKDCTRVTLPITQQDLANLLGLTRETTGTQLKELERQGVVRYHRQKYTIFNDKLNAALEER